MDRGKELYQRGVDTKSIDLEILTADSAEGKSSKFPSSVTISRRTYFTSSRCFNTVSRSFGGKSLPTRFFLTTAPA